jgi:prophage antirepressor-like protein
MSEIIKSFDFETKEVRIIGDNKKPWFIAKDICNILELSNVSQAVSKLPEKWKGIYQNDTLGGKQNMITISEAGVYKLIMRSDKIQSQKFQEWVCEDLLPTLRQKGEYKMNESYQLKLEEMNRLLDEKQALLEDTKKDLKEKTLRVKYTENILTETKEVLSTKAIELKKLKKNHSSMLKQRRYHTFKLGKCFYVWVYPECGETKFKVGMTGDINQRLKDYRTSVPELQLIYIVYLNENDFLEKAVLLRLDKYRVQKNHELVRVSGDTIIETARFVIEYFKLNHTEEEELHLYNEIEEEEEEKAELSFVDEKGEEITFKTCSKCQESLTFDKFALNSKRGDGYDNNCRECNKKKYVASKTSEKKEIDMKECTRCKKVLEVTEFNNRVGSSDGKSSECKDCAVEMYHKRAENREYVKAEDIKKCLNCEEEKSIEEFGKKTDSPDGYMPNCKVCWSKKANGPAKKKVEPPTHKVCNKCDEDKSIDSFWKRSSYKDGYLNTCSVCCGKNRKK